MAKKLPPKEYLCECLNYDPKTGLLVWRSRPTRHFKNHAASVIWNKGNQGHLAGWTHPSRSNRIYIRIDGVSWAASRIVWKMMTGTDPKELIDHKDRDGSNNRWENLREATVYQNSINRGAMKTIRSGLKGAYQKMSGRWMSRISVNGDDIYLGTFDTKEQAHAAYLSAAAKMHGEFAALNV